MLSHLPVNCLCVGAVAQLASTVHFVIASVVTTARPVAPRVTFTVAVTEEPLPVGN